MAFMKYYFAKIVFEADLFCLFLGQIQHTLFLEIEHLKVL